MAGLAGADTSYKSLIRRSPKGQNFFLLDALDKIFISHNKEVKIHAQTVPDPLLILG